MNPTEGRPAGRAPLSVKFLWVLRKEVPLGADPIRICLPALVVRLRVVPILLRRRVVLPLRGKPLLCVAEGSLHVLLEGEGGPLCGAECLFTRLRPVGMEEDRGRDHLRQEA